MKKISKKTIIKELKKAKNNNWFFACLYWQIKLDNYKSKKGKI